VKGKDLSKGSHHWRYIVEGCFRTGIEILEGDNAYRVEVAVVTDGQASKELLVAHRIGDCKK
jgi:hypothetical protein